MTITDSASPAARCTAMASRSVPSWPVVGGEEEVTHGLVAAVPSGLVVEAPELLAREERQADVDGRRKLRAETAGSPPGAAGAGGRGVIEEHDGTAPERSEVPRDCGAHDAGADDHDVGGARHAVKTCSGWRKAFISMALPLSSWRNMGLARPSWPSVAIAGW